MSMQMDPEIGLTKCSRCGRDAMRSDIALNALSRHLDVYICSECGIEETMLDLEGKRRSLKDWYPPGYFRTKTKASLYDDT